MSESDRDRGAGDCPRLYDPLLVEDRMAARRYPLPLDSVEAIRRALEHALANVREERAHAERKRREQHEPPGEEDLEEEGPSRLARAFDRLRLYAYPYDRARWEMLDRARHHRQWMLSAHNHKLLTSILGTVGDWEFIGPRRFDTGGGPVGIGTRQCHRGRPQRQLHDVRGSSRRWGLEDDGPRRDLEAFVGHVAV